MEELIESIKQLAGESWKGDVGEERAEKVETFLRKRIPEYAKAFGLSETEVLQAIEGQRNYCAVNYYQEANFPSLEDVRIFETQEDLKKAVPSMKFRCPMCKGVSTNPYRCNSGVEIQRLDSTHGECDWKTYGLFRSLGEGLRFTIKEGFLEQPRIDEIFMPLDLEEQKDGRQQD